MTLRKVHLLGGVRACEFDLNEATIFPSLEQQPLIIRAPTRASFYNTVQADTSLRAIGCEFISTENEIDGIEEPEWRPFDSNRGGWVTFDAKTIWREIANGAKENSDLSTSARAHHISTQLQTCAEGLKRLSDDYEKHINSVVSAGKFSDGQRVSGYFSEKIFTSTESIIKDLATLRDFLARFISIDILGLNHNIDSMPILLNEIKKRNISHEVADWILYIHDEKPNWMRVFGEYRNLLVHNVPLKHAGGLNWIIQKSIWNKRLEREIPTCTLILPSEPGRIRDQARNQEFHTPRDFKDQTSPENGPDALDYAHDLLIEIARLSKEISRFSPIEPLPIKFTVNNIIPGTFRVI